jgi:hypothetical protein
LALARLDDDGAPASPVVPIRLRLAPVRSRGGLDGAWWPPGRSLDALAALAAELARRLAPVHRVSLNPSRWPANPPRLRLATGGELRIDWFPHLDPDTITVGQGKHAALLLLVIPPQTRPGRVAELMHRIGTDPITFPASAFLAGDPETAHQPTPALVGAETPGRRPGPSHGANGHETSR